MTLPVSMAIPAHREVIVGALEGLVGANMALIAEDPGGYPPLLVLAARGAKFRPERPGREDWKNAQRLVAELVGDCEDWAGYQAALYRRTGEPAFVDVVPIDNDGHFHAVVRRASGMIEDPSMLIIEREAQRMSNTPTLELTRGNGCVLGALTVPLAGGHTMRCESVGAGPTDALRSLLRETLQAANDPKIMGMMPPRVQLALLAIHGINEMSDHGLEKLLEDDRATPAQRKLATKVRQARQETGDPKVDPWNPTGWPSSMGWPMVGIQANTGIVDHRSGAKKYTPGAGIDPAPTRSGAPQPNVRSGTVAPPSGSIRPDPRIPTNPYASVPAGSTAPPVRVTTTTGTPSGFQPGDIDPKTGLPIPYPGQIDQASGLVWVAAAGQIPGHWERPRGATLPQDVLPPGTQQPGYGQMPLPPSPYWGQPPGYPPMMPGMPGYGSPPFNPYGSPPFNPYGGMPPYGMPYDPYGGYGYGYGMDPMSMLMAWGMPPVMQGDPSQIQRAPLEADEAAAIMLWGSGAFAEGSFPGYQLNVPPPFVTFPYYG